MPQDERERSKVSNNSETASEFGQRLERVEAELEESIERVCDEPRVEEVDTGELIRIEETLAIAARAAKEAVSLRRRIRADRDANGGTPDTR
jgi:hypothetical protein